MRSLLRLVRVPRSVSVRTLGFLSLLCLCAFLGSVGRAALADGSEAGSTRGAPVVVETYRGGPLASRDSGTIPELPDGARELLGLSVLATVLYGLRASGLGRSA